MDDNSYIIWIVTILGFIGGYIVVGHIFDQFRKRKPKVNPDFNQSYKGKSGGKHRQGRNDNTDRITNEYSKFDKNNHANYYSLILGLDNCDSMIEIKQRYKELASQ